MPLQSFPPAQTVGGVIPHTEQSSTDSQTANNISSTSYSDLPGASVSLVKLSAASLIVAIVEFTAYFSNAGGYGEIGLSIGGSDFGAKRIFRNTANDHGAFTATFRISGIAVGTYTIKPRLRVASPAVVNWDSNDHISLTVMETF